MSVLFLCASYAVSHVGCRHPHRLSPVIHTAINQSPIITTSPSHPQDTKNAATRAAAALLATSGHAMPATAAAAAVANVADRLSSETTRLPALRAIEEVARAAGATGVGVGDVARRVVGEATQFLKLAHRPTRIAALGVVTALATEGEVRGVGGVRW